MCGRYVFYSPPDVLKNRYGVENILNMPARYNCAPMQDLPIIVHGRLGNARWGLRPAWAKEDNATMASKMINARSETVHEKPAFRDSWARGRRCLVPVNGFYEWPLDEDGNKQPFYISSDDDDLMFFAGLWSKVGEQVSFTILTKPANGAISNLHTRAPVIIAPHFMKEWFKSDLQNAHMLINEARHDVRYHKVGHDVGKVARDHAGLIEPLAA